MFKVSTLLCPCSQPSTQTPAQPSLPQMQLTQSRLEVIYCFLGVFSNCIFFSCQELTATARVLINGSCYLVHLKGEFRKHLLALLASGHNDSQANYIGHPVIGTIVTGGKQMPREAGSKIMMYFTVFLLLTDLNKDLKCSVSTESVKVPASLNSPKFKLSSLMESDW